MKRTLHTVGGHYFRPAGASHSRRAAQDWWGNGNRRSASTCVRMAAIPLTEKGQFAEKGRHSRIEGRSYADWRNLTIRDG